MPDPIGEFLLPNLPLVMGVTLPLAPFAVWQWRKAGVSSGWTEGARAFLAAVTALPLTLLLGRVAFEFAWPTHEPSQRPCPNGCVQYWDLEQLLEPILLLPLDLALGLGVLGLLTLVALLIRLRLARLRA